MEIEKEEFTDADRKMIEAFTDALLAILERLGELDDKIDVIYRMHVKPTGILVENK